MGLAGLVGNVQHLSYAVRMCCQCKWSGQASFMVVDWVLNNYMIINYYFALFTLNEKSHDW
jgi:hypothetical protein